MSTYEISKSSLLSLKAEILRKEEVLLKAKAENSHKIRIIKENTPLELKNKGVEERKYKDLNDEEIDLLKLSKSKLEAKAKLYEELSCSSNQNEHIKKRYLVRFDEKERVSNQFLSDSDDAPDLVQVEDEERHFSDEYEDATDPSEEWVEYIDCLGRTRKCLRKDLDYLKSKDADLKVTVEKRTQVTLPEKEVLICQSPENKSDQKIESQASTNESEMIPGDMRKEMLRKQWEQEEDELRNKTDIHYQNILFNEARQHGVGYYAFSKDEEERVRQQEDLKKLREETEKQQKKAQGLKALREKQMAARMKAANNRKRVRMGLPPEEDEPTPPFDENKKSEEEEKKENEAKEKAEQAEKLLMEARKSHIRPWDIGKEGVVEHYEMTQEEWNEKKRQERHEEFAPPKSYGTRDFSSMKILEEDYVEKDKSLRFSSKKKNAKKQPWLSYAGKLGSVNPYKNSEPTESVYISNEDQLLEGYKISQNVKLSSRSRGISSQKNDDKDYYEPEEPTDDFDFKRKLLKGSQLPNNIYHEFPVAIDNECEETDFNDRLLTDHSKVLDSIRYVEDYFDDEQDRSRKRGVEIAPPPTFEYYGPMEGKRPKNSQQGFNIEDSIEAGLKFLRKQAERTGKHCVDDI